jgi:hypothetical protein
MSNREAINRVLESMKTATNFMKDVGQCLIDNNKKQFETIFENYKSYRIEKSTDKEKSIEDIEIDIRKSICGALINFMHIPEFNENKVFDYLDTLNDEISPQILSFLLWSQEKKEAAFSLLKVYPADFTSEQYDFLYEAIKLQDTKCNGPLLGKERVENFEKQKNEFLFHQSRYYIKSELEKLPVNEAKPKRIKL